MIETTPKPPVAQRAGGIYVYVNIYVYAYIAGFRCTCMVDLLTRCNIHDYRFDAATAVAREFNTRIKAAKVRETRR